nr:replication endonuclease [Delftia acidovorans]
MNLAELSAPEFQRLPALLETHIRGTEEYADARNHVGLFLTLTVPSRFHTETLGSGGRPRPNPRYDGVSTPRDAQLWLRNRWQRVRSQLDRDGVLMYGIRVAEPHRDATPHWHALVWAEHEGAAQRIEQVIRDKWLADDGDESGAAKNRINVKRMTTGGAAGYVAKYIAKSVGHTALADHLAVAQGQLRDVEQGDMSGHRRVDAWAACWGIRQFQAVGMPRGAR